MKTAIGVLRLIKKNTNSFNFCEAMNLAEDYERIYNERHVAECMLTAIALHVFDGNGHLKEEFKNVFPEDDELMSLIRKHICVNHAGVVCSPFSKGIESNRKYILDLLKETPNAD